MSDVMVEILQVLFGPTSERTPRDHRVYTFYYSEKTRKGQRTFNAAKELEVAGLVRLSSGVLQNDIYRIIPRC